jgi:hypothetical protein
LLEGSHGTIVKWPSIRGEVAPDVSLGDTAVEYILGEMTEVLSFGPGSELMRGLMCVIVSFCSNGLVTCNSRTQTTGTVSSVQNKH